LTMAAKKSFRRATLHATPGPASHPAPQVECPGEQCLQYLKAAGRAAFRQNCAGTVVRDRRCASLLPPLPHAPTQLWSPGAAAMAAQELGARSQVVASLFALDECDPPAVGLSAAEALAAAQTLAVTPMPNVLEPADASWKTVAGGKWLKGDFGQPEPELSSTLGLQLQAMRTHWLVALNLERARPGSPAATATVEKYVSSLLRYLGFCVRVQGVKGASATLLLRGDVLMRYLAFMVDVRERSLKGVYSELKDLVACLRALTALHVAEADVDDALKLTGILS